MERCVGRWFADDDDPGCDKPAVVCSECVRALALKWWGSIARHGEDVVGDRRCELCELGQPSYCGDHAIAAIVRQRGALREGGVLIGEREFLL
jgi:hypothetical protein